MPTHRKTLALSGLYAFGNLIRRGVHVILLPLYTAYLTTADFGKLALMTVTGGVLAMLISTPLVTGGLMRFYHNPDFRDRQGALLFNLFVVLAVLSTAVAAVWFAAAGPICRTLLGDASLVGVVRLYAVALLLWPVSTFLLALMNQLQMGKLYIVVCFVEACAVAATVSVGFVCYHMGLGAVVLGAAAGMAVTTLIALPVFVRRATFRLDRGVLGRPLAFGLPLLPEGLSRLAMQLGDRYVLRGFVTTAQIGLYSFGYSLSEVIDTAIGTPVHDGVNPSIRQLEHDPDRQKRFIRSSATLYYLLAVFAGLVLALYSREVVMLLATDPTYHPAWIIMPVVTLAFVQQALGPFLDWGMVMKNKSYHISGVLIFSALVNIGLNFWLIPLYGIMGAAVATLASYFLWNVLKGYFSWRFYGLMLDLRRLAHITMLAVAVYGLSLLVTWPDDAGGWLWIGVAVKAALAALFVVLCYFTGVLSRENRARLRGFPRHVRSDGLRAALAALVRPSEEAD